MFPAPEILVPERREENRSAPTKCPRCDSANTKFCYFNNYSRSQPRHFCRSCRRYWTEGGALRNVPIGGIRKNRRRKIAPAAIAAGGVPATATSGELEGAVRPPLEPSDSPSVYSIERLFDSPLPHAPLTFMKDFAGGMTAAAAAPSLSCSSPFHYSCRGYGTGGDGEEGYWDFWQDVAGFTGAGGR